MRPALSGCIAAPAVFVLEGALQIPSEDRFRTMGVRL